MFCPAKSAAACAAVRRSGGDGGVAASTAAAAARRCLQRLWRGIDCGSRRGVVPPKDDTEDAESL